MYNFYAQSFARCKQYASLLMLTGLMFLSGVSMGQTYCTSGAQFADDGEISNVTIGGVVNPSTCGVAAAGTGSIAGRYANYTGIPGYTPHNAPQGNAVTFSVTMNSCSDFAFEYAFSIYADWNFDGDFNDVGENVYTSPTSEVSSLNPVTVSNLFNVPVDANIGVTRVRVVMIEQPGTFNSCGSYTYGETEDYPINILGNGNCFGTPNPGNTLTTNAAPVGANTFTLTLQNPVPGAGVSYQWQSSANLAGPYTDISGATTSNLTTTTGSVTYYRCMVSCGLSGSFANSNPVLVTPAPLTLVSYCAPPIASSTADEEIFNVTFGNINQTSVCGTGAQYGNFTTSPCPFSFTIGETYPLSLTLGMCGTFAFSGHAEVFIDYNRNGAFDLPAERAFRFPAGSGTSFAPNPVTGQVVSTNVTIPTTALPGNALMRVMYFETATDYNGCGAAPSSWGDTEDYFITMSAGAAVACTGTPTVGPTTSSVDSTCAGTTVFLSLTGCPGEGLNYQWQSSPDNINYTNINATGATSSAYNATLAATTWYRCLVTCAASGLSSTSIPKQVKARSQFACYCASAATSTADEEIFNVTFGTLNNSSTCTTTAPGPNSVAGLYSNYTTSVAAPTLFTGTTVPISLTLGMCGVTAFSGHAEVWIDLNANGSWDAGEMVMRHPSAINTSFAPNPVSGQVVTANISIPSTAAVGLTMMRVMYFETSVSFTGCGTPSSWGETEDYLVNISIPPPCTANPTMTANATPAGYCVGFTTNVALNATGAPNQSGITYQWQSSPDGSAWTNVGSSASTPSFTAAVNTNTYFQLLSTCAAVGTPSTSNSVLISGNLPPVAGVVSGPTSGLTDVVGTFTVTGASNIQWQVSLDNITWQNVAGATGSTQGLISSFATTYFLRVVSTSAGCTNAISNVVSWVVALGNDNVCGTLPALVVGQNGLASNFGSTVQSGEPFPPTGGCNTDSTWCFVPGSNSVWFTFTPAVSGAYSFSVVALNVTGSGQPALSDSQIAIWSANSCAAVTTPGGATLLAANDDGNGVSALVSENCMEAGKTYYIQVDGYSSSVGTFRVDVTLIGALALNGLPATACGQDPFSIVLSGTPAGGTFSGPGILPNTNLWNPAIAGDGTKTITYSVGCFSITKTVVVSSNQFFYDADLDTYGSSADPSFPPLLGCNAIAGYVMNNLDCNDGSANTNPASPEICDGLDNNCNLSIDEGVATTYYFDGDFDLYGVTSNSITSCSPQAGFVPVSGDCDDTDASINPIGTEICDAKDNDCDGSTDEGFPYLTYYVDVDGDGFGLTPSAISFCESPGSNWVFVGGDCNDINPAIRPNAQEICDGVDNDCDNLIDGFDPSASGATVYYIDADGDGFGFANTSIASCNQVPGYVLNNQDCNDQNPNINPNGIEVPGNGINEDCDALVDETCDKTNNLQATNIEDYKATLSWNPIPNAISYRVQYQKLGSTATTVKIIQAPNTVFADPDLSPLSGYRFRVRVTCTGGTITAWSSWYTFYTNQKLYADLDGDGFGTPTVVYAPSVGPNISASTTDCNDTDDAVYPGAFEACNQIDDNCNSLTDEGYDVGIQYADADNDGFGNPAVSIFNCTILSGYVTNDLDCNDASSSTYPGAPESCNDNDDDCDGNVDFCEGPTVITYSNVGTSTATVTWDAPNCVQEYRLRSRINYGGGVFSDWEFITVPFTETSYTFTGLESLVRYQVQVQAKCNIGEYTPFVLNSFVTKTTIYLDMDEDGFGDVNTAFLNDSLDENSNQTLNGTDCNDADNLIYPGAYELCNFTDDDCNGLIDDAIPYTDYFKDTDADGFGAGDAVSSCKPLVGYVTNSTDCNDNVATIYPGAPEVCNLLDEDCDGSVDEGVQTTFYADADNDTYGNPNVTTLACIVPTGFAANTLDCNDANPLVPNLNTCAAPTGTNETNVTKFAATLNWLAPNCESSFLLQYRPQVQQTIAWTWVPLNNITAYTYTATLLNPGKTYIWRVRSVCGAAQSASANDQFTTLPANSPLMINEEESAGSVDAFAIFPNPGRGLVNLVMPGEEVRASTISVLDQLGRVVISVDETLAGNIPYLLDISELPVGMYMISVQQGSELSTQRYLKQ